VFIITSRRQALPAEGRQKKIGQGFDHSLQARRQWTVRAVMIRVENKLC
jgi:hypothetical protein